MSIYPWVLGMRMAQNNSPLKIHLSSQTGRWLPERLPMLLPFHELSPLHFSLLTHCRCKSFAALYNVRILEDHRRRKSSELLPGQYSPLPE